MKNGNILGFALIVLGIVSLSYAGITYTRREKVLQIGNLVATADKTETIPLPPVIGAVALVLGVGLLVFRRES